MVGLDLNMQYFGVGNFIVTEIMWAKCSWRQSEEDDWNGIVMKGSNNYHSNDSYIFIRSETHIPWTEQSFNARERIFINKRQIEN